MWETWKGKNSRIRLYGRGKPRYFPKDRIKGRDILEWMEKYELTGKSSLTVWLHRMIKINASNDFHETLISKWKFWTNAKGILRNIGLGRHYDGGSFSNYKTREIK